MSELISNTVNDMRAGATSWRVMMFLSGPALMVGVLVGVMR